MSQNTFDEAYETSEFEEEGAEAGSDGEDGNAVDDETKQAINTSFRRYLVE